MPTLLRRNLSRRFPALLLLLFLITQAHALFHHHDDLDDHPDCSICAVAHHQAAEPLPITTFTPPIISSTSLLFVYPEQFAPATTSLSSNNRAPPV